MNPSGSGWGGFSPAAELAIAVVAFSLLVALAQGAPKVGRPLLAVVAVGMFYAAVKGAQA